MSKKGTFIGEIRSIFSFRNDTLRAAYASDGYTLKEVGDYFQLHFTQVSKIVAKRKT
jgi:hypothetical protein